MARNLSTWATMRNPERVPTPRTAEEWAAAREKCSDLTGDNIQRLLDNTGLTGTEVFGHGFETCRQLSAYAAQQAPGMVEMLRLEQTTSEDALKAQFQNWYASKHRYDIAADPELPAVTVHPVLRCGVCGGRRPHTPMNERVVICDACGTRTDVAS